MTIATLEYNGLEQTLSDWGGCYAVKRIIANTGDDELSFHVPGFADGTSLFPFAAYVIFRRARVPSRANFTNSTLAPSVNDGGGALTFSGGEIAFQGYCLEEKRIGQPAKEELQYRFVGPFQFFFDRTIFQKLQLSYNPQAGQMIPDWESDVILGLSLSPLTAGSDTVPGTTVTTLMSIAQQVKEICTFAKVASENTQANGADYPAMAAGIASWPEGAQIATDDLTSEINAAGYDLLATPSTNVLIADFASLAAATVPGTNLTNALGSFPNAGNPGVYVIRAPLDAANAITCRAACERQLQWLGGVGSPVVWTDHTTFSPTLHVATRQDLQNNGDVVSLALGVNGSGPTAFTVRPDNIRPLTDLIPSCVHYKFKVQGSFNGAAVISIYHDIAAYIDGVLVEGVGQLGSLTDLGGNPLSGPHQTLLMLLATTVGANVQTIDLTGNQITAQSCKLTTTALDLADPTGGGSSTAFWKLLFPHLAETTSLKFFDPVHAGVTITDPTGATTYYQNGAWAGTAYAQMINAGCQVAPWMLVNTANPASPATGSCISARIKATFAYSETLPGANSVPGSNVENKPLWKDVYLTTLAAPAPGSTFYSAPSIQTGEPVPFGLAGYFLALESIPIFQGSIIITEEDISGQLPIGNVANLTGGLAAWTSMNACVQRINEDYDTGTTEIEIGAAKHLGPVQFVQRQRTNIGVRVYPLFNINPLGNAAGSGGQQLSSNISHLDASAGAEMKSFMQMLGSLTGYQVATSNTLPQGIHFDAAGNWGGNTPPAATAGAPQQLVAYGGAANPFTQQAATAGDAYFKCVGTASSGNYSKLGTTELFVAGGAATLTGTELSFGGGVATLIGTALSLATGAMQFNGANGTITIGTHVFSVVAAQYCDASGATHTGYILFAPT